MKRTSGAEEAILLAMEDRDAWQYLVEHAKTAGFWSHISEETEAKLLSRGNRLLDLTLAEYCSHRETAQELFNRDAGDWPIRSLVLSNQVLPKSSFRGFPECLFGSKEAVLDFLRTVSPDERAMLFSNPAIDERFLEDFLMLKEPWQVMPPEQRLWALDNLGASEKMLRKRSTADHDDGWDWYTAGKPFAAAWSLIERLEANAETAKHLSSLLRDLPADSYKTEGIGDALSRWSGDGDDPDEAEKNAKGRLSDFQEVRQAGARLLASRPDADLGRYLDSDDIALRCGAYEGARKLTEEAIEEAVERDGDLARLYLIRNERLWRKEETRDLLLDDVLRGSESDEPRWEFERRDRHYRKQFPAWYEGEGYSEPDERPVSESSIADIVTAMVGDESLRSMRTRLISVERTQQTLTWMVGAALLILVIQSWR